MKQEKNLRKSEQTRQFIIEKAAPIFNKKGYAGTSLSDITAATGLSKGSIYGNFRNKDEVAVCAFEHNLDFIRQYLRTEMEGLASYADKLKVYPKTFRRMYRELMANGGCPILNTVTEADDTHPLLHRLAVQAIVSWKKNIISLLESGKNAGEIAGDTDTEAFAEIMISLLEGGTLMAKATGEENYLLHAIGQTEKIIQDISVC